MGALPSLKFLTGRLPKDSKTFLKENEQDVPSGLRPQAQDHDSLSYWGLRTEVVNIEKDAALSSSCRCDRSPKTDVVIIDNDAALPSS